MAGEDNREQTSQVLSDNAHHTRTTQLRVVVLRGRFDLFVCQPKILHKHCFQFLLGPFYLPRENEDNAYAKFWAHKQRALRYVMVFSGVNDVARE